MNMRSIYRGLLFLVGMALPLSASAASNPANVPTVPTIAGGVGLLDVTAFHGCIGVTLANVLPWNKPQLCNITTGSVGWK